MTHEEVVERLKEILAELEAAAASHFLEGDLVRSLGMSSSSSRVPPEGHVGVVRKVDMTMGSGETILVEWESPWAGNDGDGCGFVRRESTGWWMSPSNLKPA